MSEYQFKTDYPELEEVYDFKSKAIPDVSQVNFVVTHGNCADGFMSRVIIEKEMRENPDRFTTPLEEVEFVDCHHGRDYRDLVERMRGKTVLICDFSFYRELFEQMIEATEGKILVLDHHITAKSIFENIPAKYAVFDMKHSGAFITQVYVHGFQSVPKAVLYVEDNDIWTKKLPNTLEFTAFMFLQEFEYDSYIKLFDDEFVQNTAIPIGVGAVLQNQNHIGGMLDRTKVAFMELKGRYYFVAHVNCAGILRSDLGNQSLKRFEHANFAACYTQNLRYGSTSFSLRSMDDRSDASFIASQYGGGGHRNASGMGTTTLTTYMPGRIIDEMRAYELLSYVYSQRVGDYQFLLLNTPVMKTAFCKYLIQERYTGDRDSKKNEPRTEAGLPGYQEGMFVRRVNTGNQDLDEVYDGAICWNYDGNKNRYFVTISPLSTRVEQTTRFMERCVAVYCETAEGASENNPDVVTPFEVTENKGVFYASFDPNQSFTSPQEFVKTMGEYYTS